MCLRLQLRVQAHLMSGANLEADLILCSVLSCAKKVAAKPWPALRLAEAFEHREQNSDENNV